MSVSKNTCQYEGCDRRINAPHSQTYCLFHAPAEEKGVDEATFNQSLIEQMQKGDFNFEGYVFPYSVNFYEILNNVNDNNVPFVNQVENGNIVSGFITWYTPLITFVLNELGKRFKYRSRITG